MARLNIVSALPQEIQVFCRLMGIACPTPAQPWSVSFKVNQHEVVVGISGMGADRMRALLAGWRGEPPDVWVSLGFSGGLTHDMPRSSIACGYRVLDPTGQEIPVQTLPKLTNTELKHWSAPHPLVTSESKRLAGNRYGAALVDLELFEVARHAANQDRAFLWIRGVSDGVTDELPFAPEDCLNEGGWPSAPRALALLLKRPWLLGSLFSLARTTRTLSKQLAEQALELMGTM